jgi:hypothetical protein
MIYVTPEGAPLQRTGLHLYPRGQRTLGFRMVVMRSAGRRLIWFVQRCTAGWHSEIWG